MGSIRARAAVLAALTVLSGCSSWRVQPLPVATVVEQRKPDQIQLRWPDGRRVVLRHPVVAGDSLVGVVRKETVRMAAADVSAVAIRRFDPLKTTGMVVLTVGATVGIACAMACGFGTIGFGGWGY